MVDVHVVCILLISYVTSSRCRVHTVDRALFLVIAAYDAHTRFLLASVINNGVLSHLMRQVVKVQFTLCPDICSKLILQFSMR
jgi:hypothetical protein